MVLMLIFGGSALLLAAIGIYGLMAFSVEQRTREIGIRIALGARNVQGMVIRQGMQLVIDGTDPEITREILESNIAVLEKRHKVGISVFEAAGGYSPTLGIIGTVMGLVMVLGNLSNPEELSKSIASA